MLCGDVFSDAEIPKALKLVETTKTAIIMDRSDLSERKEIKLGWLKVEDLCSEGGSAMTNFGKGETSYTSYALLAVAVVGTIYYTY